MALAASGRTLGVGYEIYAISGEVGGVESWTETRVHGSVQGNYGSVSSSSTRYQRIFLRDPEAQEHPIELVNFEAPCRPGHKLTIFWVIRKGGKRGPFFRVLNHSTGRSYSELKSVRRELAPRLLRLSLYCGVAVGLATALLGYAGVIRFTGESSGAVNLAIASLVGGAFVSIDVLLILALPAWILRRMRASRAMKQAPG